MVEATRPHQCADLAALAYQRLRELIVQGRLGPGSRLVEKDVADRLGMSRTPVRSALQRLVQEGYVVLLTAPGRQPRQLVAPLTRRDAVELFALLGALEGVAAGEAAKLPEPRRRQVVAELQRLTEELALIPPGDLNPRFDNDTEFHQVYIDAAAGPRLRTLHDFVKPQAERYIRVYISLLAGASGASHREHAAITEAITQSDAAAAKLATETNWRNAAERLTAVIEEVGARGDWLGQAGVADRHMVAESVVAG